ncbi:hypothetical protein [Streptomyces pilosus]|uniref:Uncharacterized protein n=1 Tax=Streptomyces pilosus TaxID=28893 RepID=A0A918EVZ0_9ACTN|nr:hypothetical protein [Streptomyces pilosus]GGQ69681.1 hypothetical protein GCM10010280_15110 [Streptomyces pilosus]GGV54811.1 hypothetical protein GCM10010261_38010 [Streptomyces pilosus]
MSATRHGTTRRAETAVPAGRTRWGIVALILGAPALFVFGLLFLLLLWVLLG